MLASPSAHRRSSRSDDESIMTSDSSIKTPDSSVTAISPRSQRHVKMSNEYLYMFPPVPAPRATGAALRDFNLPKPVSMDLGVIDDDAMEAAWEDGSCVDGSSPRLKQGGSFSGSEDEVDALKRQVEQLQMALQLQGQQLAYVESQHGHQSFVPQQYAAYRTGQAAPSRPPKAISRAKAYPAQPPPPSAALPKPNHAPHTADSLPHSYRQHGPAVAHPYADLSDRQRTISSPQPSVDSDKLEHIDRKLAVLEQLIEAMNVSHSNSSLPPSRPTTATAAPQQRALQPTPSPVPATPSLKPKLSSILGLKKPASTDTLTYTHRNSVSASSLGGHSTESQTTSTARVSWSRKRTERVEQPKVKLRRAAGRGRMSVGEPVA